jgi:hypothetical protein
MASSVHRAGWVRDSIVKLVTKLDFSAWCPTEYRGIGDLADPAEEGRIPT